MVRTKPDDEYDRKLLADVNDYGWHLIGIDDPDSDPAYVFSVGMFHTLGHPEICMFGLNQTQVMGQIINGIGELIRSGQQFEDRSESTDVLDGFPCMFRSVDRSLYREFFGYARWFYEGDEFPILQCVWPDKRGQYPWDSDSVTQVQPVMATYREWPFLEPKNTGVFTTTPVIEGQLPILHVSHDQDGDWQFLCGTTQRTEDAKLVCLSEMIEMHPSLAELATLPAGWYAERSTIDDPWTRAQIDTQ